ncbi:MAG: hypothetical protein ABIO49_05025 [Dokdonella sp.]
MRVPYPRAVMPLSWISTAAALPLSGASILFVLDHREGPMNGTYTQGVFHSRWSDYDVDNVRLWRASSMNAVAPVTATNPQRQRSMGALNWLFRRLQGHHAVVSVADPLEPLKSRSMSVHPVEAPHNAGRRSNSNQMSS